MHQKLLSLALLFLTFNVFSQNISSVDSGNYIQSKFICNQENLHKKYFAETQYIKDSLISNGILDIKKENYPDDHILLEWPVAQNINFNEPDYYGISNFVDHNEAYPDQILDYNCGTVSYDLPSGYNHAGVDIFAAPFPWMKMDNNQVVIVAAVAGVIIYKAGSNYDLNCDFSNSESWNAVYVLHEDGSTAWYGHLKKNSLTEKEVGETVSTGEFLGVMGSSGSSTGPHLHFELYNSDDELIDPYVGPCNPSTSTSWWRNQKPYKDPRVLKIMTHIDAPIPYGCVSEEQYNAEINFSPGQNIFLASYLSDQTVGDVLYHRLLSPGGEIFDEWEKEFESNYASSYWYYTRSINNSLPTGKWTYQVVYESQQVLSHNFYIKNEDQKPILSTEQNIEVENDTGYFSIIVSNIGEVGLNISNIETSAGLSADWQGDIAPGESNEILVQMKNNLGDAEFIEIFHNAENSPSIVYVSDQPVSLIQSSITEYDFGEVMVDVYDTLKLPLENPGLETLQIQDVMVPTGFLVNRTSFEIEAQEIDTLEVFFMPTQESVYSGQLKIVSNASNNSEFDVRLLGTGIPNVFLSTEEFLSKEIKLYPNPVRHQFNLNFESINSPICLINIIDKYGKVIANYSIDQKELKKEYKLNVKELSSGTYYLKILGDDNEVYIKRFIKR
ncbi:hypothetical protein MATR_12130 [Marivirga tractuosa]|uniref:Peptidase M23 n=1 Tax=Marivirga tractuosa (strain ATCC 23168 / DSM 4126 / NBRC 15989 / NCIMB 1408 / VKM B-1430 / H-43) TaxID=643867 RepID=E4TVP5_MARTH|nr:peptidoglycan DD-metalloendopeptidase family protein [Marivirga tractuosa]ADR21158.1 Peptidase M23 [Marivirga tractuosa DSM 4126]BDD14388.1 hypothetical protein MATR_12130 [Marivirga tractuosa]